MTTYKDMVCNGVGIDLLRITDEQWSKRVATKIVKEFLIS